MPPDADTPEPWNAPRDAHGRWEPRPDLSVEERLARLEEVAHPPIPVQISEFALAKLTLRPGDVLVVNAPPGMFPEVHAEIAHQLRRVLEDAGMDNRVIVVDKEFEVDVLVPGADEIPDGVEADDT